MKALIKFEQATSIGTVVFGLLILFHLGIISGILFFDYAPVEFLWGGRMTSKDELLNFELISLVIALVCLATVLIRSGKIRAPRLLLISRIVLWVLAAVFLLNTIGNLLAISQFEKLFSIVTLILTALCLRMALEPIK